MKDQTVYITIDGSIGVGKTTFIKAIVEQLKKEHCQVFKEDYDINILNGYYNNVKDHTYNEYSHTLEMNIVICLIYLKRSNIDGELIAGSH
jgi:deoxyadenosine/deoxycytidine kinase